MSSVAVEVVKVGGSLLERPGLVQSLTGWLEQQDSAAHFVLLVGGGPAVDGLRRLNDVLPLDQFAAHWHAIRLMQLAGRAVGIRGGWQIVESWDRLRQQCSSPGISLFLAETFLRDIEPTHPGTCLPTGWQVTSDSIAARIAVGLAARRLVLLKSRPATVPERSDWSIAAQQGLVDDFFPILAPAVPSVECRTLPSVIG